MNSKPYGGISREDRISQDGGPNCDKAWHLPDKARAVKVLTCAYCGRVYARCAECEEHKPQNAAACLLAHIRARHPSGQRAPERRTTVGPRIHREYKARLGDSERHSAPSPYDDRDTRHGRTPEELGEDEWVNRNERKR